MEGKTGRRRSFLDVQRKSLLFDQLFDEDNENIPSKENRNITMKEYLSLLKEERMQWKKVRESRRKQLQELEKNISTSETNEITASGMEKFLDEEDKSFLNDEPDYLGMLENAEKYLKALHFLKRYKSDVIEHYKQIIEETAVASDELVENLCRKDMCELCNQINCNNSEHKYFPVF